LSRIKDVLDDTVDDATPFVDDVVYLYPVRLEIENPLRTGDIYNERPYIVAELSNWILQKKHKTMTADQLALAHSLVKRSTTPASTNKLQELLGSMGYDGLEYRNKVEDPGHTSIMNLNSGQVHLLGPPLKIMASEIYKSRKSKLAEANAARPPELGNAYFWINGQLVDVGEYRNHRDWLLAHAPELDLPSYIQQSPKKALWEAYKKGVVRVVWDPSGVWKSGAGYNQGAVLYLNGFERDVWNNITKLMNHPVWAGTINTVVIEYVKDVDGKPNWYHTDIFQGDQLESLYRGKRPRKSLLPADANYGGEPDREQLRKFNHKMNQINDLAEGDVFEMFQSHGLQTTFDITPNNTQNKYVIAHYHTSMR
jgi:hypothetical protein